LVEDAGAPLVNTEPSAEELFALADVARVSGHPYEAIGVLNRLIDTHPDDAMAPVAAFTIGKIQLEQLAAFDDASLSFERANLLGLPEALREQAFVRWIEALRRANNLTRCREVAEQYRSLFPNARYVGATERCGAE
jgi:transmembrane sensor